MDMITHLSDRKYLVNRYQHHYIDFENEIATFYLFDEHLRWTGYQKYNPNSFEKKCNNIEDARYFIHNQRGELCVWGLDVLHNFKGPLFVTESIFKAAALHMAGFKAITQLTSGVSKRFLALCDHLGKDGLYFVGDNDAAGIKFSEYRPGGFVLEKDLDEYGSNELRNLINERTRWFD